ncbi:major facilitator superfamily domain-containing protein [Scheffersomyces coipomensis]|uniref:major facilitator superfamily domain-containing protein n=1 Tax=Scheffersomyces coipomensis TaxID=1788519 RepID=UPI00315DE6D9
MSKTAIQLQDRVERTYDIDIIESNTAPITSAEIDEANAQDLDPNRNQNHDFPEGGWKAYSVVLGSFLGLTACFGTLNSVGAIQAYIATHQLSGINTSTVSWIFSIYSFVCFAVGILVGPLFDRKGTLIPLIGGTILIFGGLMATADCKTVWQFILSFSFCVGTGNALCINPLVGVISHWFLKKRGKATALATLGGSIGGVVIPLMLRSLYPKVGFPWAIRIFGFFCLICLISSILLSKERIYHRNHVTADDEDDDNVYANKYSKILASTKNFMDFSALKDLKYAYCIAGVFCTEVSLMSILTYYTTYAIAQGVSESTSYILLTIFNSSGVLGRILPGILSDKLGHFNVMIIMLFGMAVSQLVLWLPFGGHVGVLYAFAVICGFFSASIFSLTPVCLGAITPVHMFGQRYGLLYAIVSTGNLFGVPLGAAIIGKGTKHQYDMFALFCGVIALTGLFCWTASRYYIVGTKINAKI